MATLLPTYFGITGISATKERGSFICKTDWGTFKISKTNESFSAISLRHDLLTALASAGFPWTDETVPSIEGTPFMQLGRETFIMTRYVKGAEVSLENEADVTVALQGLANYHTKGRNLGLTRMPVSTPLPEIFAKDAAFLAKTIKQVESTTRLSDFDIVFLKNADKYVTDASEAAQLLANTNYHILHNTALHENHICHNNIKEENLLIHAQTCYITNWADASIDIQFVDLARFLERYARRSSKQVPLDKWLEVYNKILPLPCTGEEIIRAYLLHPWQFIKTCKQYYSKKRGWTPIGISTRMNNLLAEQEEYDAYVRSAL